MKDSEWRTDGHGNWYLASKLSTTGGLGMPSDLFSCECDFPESQPRLHYAECPVRIGFEKHGK